MKIVASHTMFLRHSTSLFRAVVLLCLATFTLPAKSQYYILGRGLDDDEVPYANANARLTGKDYSAEQICTYQGVFRFENLKAGSYELVLITPYGMRRKKIDLKGSIDLTLHIARNIQMDEISVIASRAGSDSPVTHDDITATDIKKKDFGKDMPYLLEGTPSVVATSDAGTGIGYTGLRIRGSDPTRINVTLNGIPVNDAESQQVFWVDLPDVASSSTNIQVQRGVGWSQPGTGDFGGSVNINTMGFHFKPYAEVKLGAGSYNTQRGTLSLGSGLLNGRFTFDGRGSYIHSDGFIDRAKSDLYSIYGAAGYHHDQNNVSFVFALGDELTYQAWDGVPEQYVFVDSTRTYNAAGTEKPGTPYDNEVDDYRQTNYQLHFDQAVTPFARLTAAVHYTKGKGFFEQYKANQDLKEYGLSDTVVTSDVVRQLWLDNDFYGFTSTLHFGKPEERYFIIGTGWNKYLGDHFNEVTWTALNGHFEKPATYYQDDAEKRDWNLFGRTNMKVSQQFDMTVDLQGRWIRYQFNGPDTSGALIDQEVNHQFFNPKLGFTYKLSEKSSFYALTGLNHKEPNRDDYVESTPLSRPRAERLWDTELGYRFRSSSWNLTLTGYYMGYKDQLVPTGRLNDVGAYTRVNVDDSHRLGIETSFSLTPVKKLDVQFNATLSDNRIKSYDEFIDNWTTGVQEVASHKNSCLAFSPSVLSSLLLNYKIFSNAKWEVAVDLNNRYVGKQYVDNTSRTASELQAYFVSDLGLTCHLFTKNIKDISIGLMINNLFNEEYESNGWIYRFRSEDYNPVPDDPYADNESGTLYHQKGYFPQAWRNMMVQFNFNF
jgi:iron complex outermembrane recepter protein